MGADTGQINRVAIVGNIGAGKTTLARHLAVTLNLPLHELDKVFFQPGYKDMPADETIGQFRQILETDRWIVEGVEKAPVLEMAIMAADLVVMIDLPLPVHYWRAGRRRVLALWHGHPDEFPVKRGWREVLGQFRTLWRAHWRLVPRLRETLTRTGDTTAVHHLRSGRALDSFTHQFD